MSSGFAFGNGVSSSLSVYYYFLYKYRNIIPKQSPALYFGYKAGGEEKSKLFRYDVQVYLEITFLTQTPRSPVNTLNINKLPEAIFLKSKLVSLVLILFLSANNFPVIS